MEFSRQEYWSGLQFPSLGDLPDPEIELMSQRIENLLHCRQILYYLSLQERGFLGGFLKKPNKFIGGKNFEPKVEGYE